jgi:NAD(P)-dependent dehydrogenase (short-subunit alcohol dehydrogenase family)
MSRFIDKIVVITGGSSGIGLAAAQAFEREGAKVVVTGRTPDTLETAAKTLSKEAIALKADVTRKADLEHLFATVGEKHGRIDVLFANAGVAKVAPLESTSEALFDEIVSTNFRGAYFTVQKALPLLNDGGAILFTTSYFDQVGIAGTSVVSASKAALRSLTRTLATELLPRKIRVNAISPGVITTPIFGKLGLPSETVDEIGKTLLAQIPVKRFGTVEEIAKAVTFLASDDASYITGSELTVDGGRTEL